MGETGDDEKERHNLMSHNNKCCKEIKQGVGLEMLPEGLSSMGWPERTDGALELSPELRQRGPVQQAMPRLMTSDALESQGQGH